MNLYLKNFFNGKSALSNGFIALILVGLIALGCTCNDKDGFKFDSDKNANTSRNDKDSDTKKDSDKDEDSDKDDDTKFEKADASKKEIPSDAEMQQIVKKTLLDFNDAIQDEDFSDFHKTISKVWQKQTTPRTFEKGFKQFLEKNVDISQIKSQKAKFTADPEVVTEDRVQLLDVEGFYPTSPEPTRFALKYIPEGKDWKLFAINVRTKSFR